MGFFQQYWPYLVTLVAIVAGGAAAIHAAMTKDDVRAASGWAAVVLVSPILGATLYAVAGINRIRRSRVRRRRLGSRDNNNATWDQVTAERIAESAAPWLVPLKLLGDTVAAFPFTDENHVQLLDGGDETYPAMLEAIGRAERSIGLQTYIFDEDPIGIRIAEALAEAVKRGVEVRVLLDAVGARYSRPPITGRLKAGNVPFALFMNALLPFKLPYANLRSHRKILVVDGDIGFSGGMNIRREFTTEFGGDHVARDTHFRFEGPVVSQLLRSLARDWRFTTGEKLTGPEWQHHSLETPGVVPVRPLDAGPDEALERTHAVLMGAFAVAQKRIRIQSPYFIPDARLVAALATAARRGVLVDIVIPEKGNLRLIDWAMAGQLDQVIAPGCKVWRSAGAFDHSKLMVVDGAWALVGSSNLDARSLRLNFELDVEIMHRETAQAVERQIERRMEGAREETLASLDGRAFPIRFRNKLLWLASPYL